MKKRLIILMLVVLSGCFYQAPVQINQPASGVSAALRSPDPTVWRSDPTRVVFQNYSTAVHVQIWVGSKRSGKPDLELGPEEGRAFNFPGVGMHTIYVAGRERLANGWKNLGTRKRPIDIYPSYETREIPVGDWDFYDNTFYRPPTFYRW